MEQMAYNMEHTPIQNKRGPSTRAIIICLSCMGIFLVGWVFLVVLIYNSAPKSSTTKSFKSAYSQQLMQSDEYFRTYEYQKTIDLINTIINNPNMDQYDHSYSYEIRANSKLKLGDISGAKADYEEALKINSPQRNKSVYGGLATLYEDQSDYQTAIKYYELAVASDPENKSDLKSENFLWHEYSIYTRDVVNNSKESLDILNRIIALNPKSAEAYAGFGFVYTAIGNHEKSLAGYTKAIEINPNDNVSKLFKAGEELTLHKIPDMCRTLDGVHMETIKNWQTLYDSLRTSCK